MRRTFAAAAGHPLDNTGSAGPPRQPTSQLTHQRPDDALSLSDASPPRQSLSSIRNLPVLPQSALRYANSVDQSVELSLWGTFFGEAMLHMRDRFGKDIFKVLGAAEVTGNALDLQIVEDRGPGLVVDQGAPPNPDYT